MKHKFGEQRNPKKSVPPLTIGYEDSESDNNSSFEDTEFSEEPPRKILKRSGTDAVGCEESQSTFLDIENLLESDDESDETMSVSVTKMTGLNFSKEEVVWEIWYRNGVGKGRVKDRDLSSAKPMAIAQLCIVNSVRKSKGRVVELGLIAVPTKGQAVNIKQTGHNSKIQFVRKFRSHSMNKLIIDSQRYRSDFNVVLDQLATVDKYLKNHIGLEKVPPEEIFSMKKFISCSSFDRCIYLEGLRRMKKGLSKQIEAFSNDENDAFREGKKNTNNKNAVLNVIAEEKKQEKLGIEEDINAVGPEAQLLTKDLHDTWALDFMRSTKEFPKLFKIMTLQKKCRRHELFIADKSQRTIKSCVPELVRISNNSFMNIFGKKRVFIDMEVRKYLMQILKKGIKLSDCDPRLHDIVTHEKGSALAYVELVLYPQLFISWIKQVKGCGILEADTFFQTIGH